MQKKRLMRTCQGDYCGNRIYPVRRDSDPRIPVYRLSLQSDNIFISWREDPYASEIRGDDTRMWLCDTCAYDSAMDI